MTSPTGGRRGATAGGLLALVIWSTTVAAARAMTESLGPMAGAAMALGLGGVLAAAVSSLRGVSPAAMLRLPPKYLLGCGGLFVAYMVCFYAAVGWAPNRPAALVVGLLNYLWPTLTVLLSVPLLGRRARWPALIGCAAAVCGTAMAVLDNPDFSWRRLQQAGGAAVWPLLFAAAAAVAWALYSNLARRWGRPDAGAVPLFLMASAAALGLLRLASDETTNFRPRAVCEMLFIAGCQALLAYVLWERAMRRGNQLLVSLASYFVPIASTAVAAGYLAVWPGPGLIAGCCLVAAGAVICKYSVHEPDGAARNCPRE